MNALPLGAVGVYVRRRLSESPLYVPAASGQRVRPARVLGEHLPTIRRCFVIAAAYSAAFNVWFLFLPSYVTATGGGSLARSLFFALTGLVAAELDSQVAELNRRAAALLSAETRSQYTSADVT